MGLRIGDKINETPQKDGTINVTLDLKHPDGDRRFVANVADPDAFYARCRYMMDNPEPIDYESERSGLIEQKAVINERITVIDEIIAIRDDKRAP